MDGGVGARTKRLVLAASCLGIFLALLRATSLNPALPAIGDDLGGGVAGLQWVLNGYTLVVASLLLTVGTLSDRLGARRLFLAGLALFALSSAVSVVAPSLLSLISFQMLLGVGGALLGPTSLALVANAFTEPAGRARALALWSAATGLGVVVGPVLGGLLAGTWGWRSVFLFNVLLALAVLALAARFVPETARIAGRGVDLAGQLTGILSLGSLSFALIESSRRGLGSAVVILAFVVFVAGAVAFVAVERRLERRGESPMLPLGLFGSPTLSAGTVTGAFLVFSVYGQFLLLALFFENVRGYSALATGLAFLPLAFVNFGASVLSGRLSARAGPRTPMFAGSAVAAVGSLALVIVGEDASYALVLINLLLVGFGGGLLLPASTEAIVSSAPKERAGIASAIANASRQASGVLGIALLGSLVSGGSAGSFISGLHLAGLICAGAFLSGAALTLVYVRSPKKDAAAAKAVS